jgi:NADPH:quinone reductase-like Zn-dependent oxidoreductase
MKAIVLTAYGDVENLELRELPEPPVGPGEVKIRMAGASINPIDWKLRSGAYHAFMPLKLPAILGRDASGEVIEVGSGVTAFKIGARVMGRVNNGYAEVVVAPEDAWVEVPASMNLADAGALPLILLTGAQLVEEAVDVRAGDRLLVTGATGSAGRTSVFAAKARGARVFAGVRASQKAEAAKLGADMVVALDDDRDLDALPQLDSIADTVGGGTIQKLFDKLKPGGTLGTIVGEPAGAKERGFIVRALMAHSDAKRLHQLAQAVARGELVIPIAKRFPLSDARQAQKAAESGAGGKVILTA